ncbi:hypothetical protein, partial [Nocardiopsis sp. TNDT3]
MPEPEIKYEDLPDKPLHELMNIFAGTDGDYKPMESIDTVTKDPWVADGRYHFHETTNPFTGFSWNYGGHEMDRWWSYREYYTAYTTGYGGGSYPYETYGIDYAGYTMQKHLWGEKTLSDGKEDLHTDDTPPPQDGFRQQLSNLAHLADYGNNQLTSENWDLTRLQKTIDSLGTLYDTLTPYIDGEGGSLNKLWQEIDVPDGAMQGSAAAAYKYRLQDMAYRMTSVHMELPEFKAELERVKTVLTFATAVLAYTVDQALNTRGGRVQEVLDDWYFYTSAGTEEFNPERDQFQVTIAYPEETGGDKLTGIPGDPPTQDNINNVLYQRFRNHYEGVYEAANQVRDLMAHTYTQAHATIPVIVDPAPLPPPTPETGGGGNGPGGENPFGDWDNPFGDWEIDNPFGDWEIDNPFGDWDNEGGGPPPPPPPPP